MANEKPAATNQEVDLDDLEVVILVIAKNPQRISQAANFLTRRGWPTTVQSNLSRAIEFASERKPDIVLISVNHPNPAMSKFSELLQTAFGATCVAFAENMDAASGARLAKSNLPVKIQGQASGPNLHRSLRKILAEKFNIQIDDKGQSAERPASDKDIKVKGNSAADQQIVMQKTEGAGHKRGPTMIRGEAAADEDTRSETSEAVSSGKYTMAKRTRRSLRERSANPLDQPGDVVMGESKDLAEKMKRALFGDAAVDAENAAVAEMYEEEHSGPAYMPNHDDEGGDPDDVNPDFDENGRAVTSRRPAGGRKKEEVFSDGPRSYGQAMAAAQRASANAKEHKAMAGHPAGPSTGGSAVPNSGVESKSSDFGAPGSSQGESNGAGSSPGQASFGAGQRPEHKELTAVGPHSIIQRAVQEALAKICRPASGDQQPIRMIERVGVFPVDSPSLPGYLVLAWPHEETRAIEPFFKRAQQIIGETFREMNVQAAVEPGFFVQLPQVDFVPWAYEEAAFCFSTAHGNEEIGVAFFATDKPIPKPKQSEDKSMYSIDVSEISTNEPVTFKVYLHMKKNKKFFLYLRNGRQLQPEQKERLEGHQVKDLYMKTIDVENMRQFMASCHLKQKLKKAG